MEVPVLAQKVLAEVSPPPFSVCIEPEPGSDLYRYLLMRDPCLTDS